MKILVHRWKNYKSKW